MKFVTKKQLEERLERARQRYACQQERLETLLLSMQNNEDNIRQMEYVLNMIDRIGKQHRRHRIIPRVEVEEFFIYASRVYDRLQHHLHLHHLNYTYFCTVISSRYLFESRLHPPNHRFISPATVISYFKKERGR